VEGRLIFLIIRVIFGNLFMDYKNFDFWMLGGNFLEVWVFLE
jgi:hypothetical protein